MEHVEVARETASRMDGTWSGSVTCLCGWAKIIQDHQSRESAAISLRAAWIVHADPA